MTRAWLHNRIVNDSYFSTLLSGRVWNVTRLEKAPDVHPFILHRQTSDIEEMRGDDVDKCRSVGYMVFCHDIQGSYLRIDQMMDNLKRLFKDTIDQPNGIIRSKWVETNDDLRDDDMGTIMKFCRLQIYYKEP